MKVSSDFCSDSGGTKVYLIFFFLWWVVVVELWEEVVL